MLKRLITIILCAVMLTSSLPTVFSAANSGEQLEKAMGLVDILNLVPDLDKKDVSTPVTRAEMALLIARGIKFDETASSGVRYFNDLAMDHWAQGAINYLAETGVISQADDRLFRPEDTVSLDEAVKMLACLAGYKPYADVHGGYPSGYYEVARMQNMLTGVSTSGSISVRDAIILTANALCMNTYNVSEIKHDTHYYGESSETLLSRYWDIYEGNGTVWAAEGISLKTDISAGFSETVIGDERFISEDFAAEQFLGQYVSFFYHDDGINKELLFCYAPSRKNDMITVLSEDFISYRDGTFKYYNENGKAESVTVSSAAAVAKNGETVTKYISEAFDIENGDFRLLDSDRDGVYDIVIINSCEIYLVNSVDAGMEIIYAKDLSGTVKVIERKDTQKLKLHNGISSMDGIKKDQVLSIYSSAKLLSIYITEANVTGKLDEVSADSKVLVTVGGTEHEMYKKCYDANKNSLTPGSSYVFRLDKAGKIAFVGFDTSAATGSMQFGYLVNAAPSNGLEGEIMCKIYTTANEMQIINFVSKPKIDGKKVEKEKVIAALTAGSGNGVVNQLIRYRTDEKGLVCEVDTALKNNSEADNTLEKTFEDLTGVVWGGNYRKFDRLGIFSGGASFTVPIQDNILTADEGEFAYKASGTWSNGQNFDGASLYTVNPNNVSDSIAVIYSSSGAGTENDFPLLFDCVTQVVDKYGTEMKAAHLFGETEEVFYIAPEYYSQWSALGISRGDVIKISTNSKGYISGVSVILDYSENKLPSGMVDEVSYPFQQKDISAGYVLRTQGNIVEWSYGTDMTKPFERLVVPSDRKIAVYDSTLRKSQVYCGSVSDILSAENVGGSASSIIVYGNSGNLRRIIVHKNGWKK